MTKKRVRRRTRAIAVRPEAPNLALEKALESGNPLLAFAALAKDRSVDPQKLEALVRLQERILDRNAQAEFEAAFQRMRPDLPIVDRRGWIIQPGKAARNYAKHEDIQLAVQPILAQYGFSLRFKTEWPGPAQVRVVGILKHIAGHSETSAFEGEPDKTGDKNGTQARGSTISYGKRYTTIDLLNIVTKGQDRDGEPEAQEQPTRGASRAKQSRPQPAATNQTQSAPPPRAGTDHQDTRPISDAQRKRLWTIANRAGRMREEVKLWLVARYKVTSSNEITRGDYDSICRAIEAPGALTVEREVGEEG